ncbi:MAG: type IV pilus modification PilV family protein [Planctomycetota bacterium]|jgi:Tfp pilus assembly protein PilV
MTDSNTKEKQAYQKPNKVCCRPGISLIEAMNAILILSIAAIGASGYRYFATLDAQKAEMQITAARIGHLLSESWRALQGAETYDPAAHLDSGLTIAKSDGPDAPEGFTSLGSYTVVLNDAAYYMTLSWKDVSTDLRALNIVLIWMQTNQGQNEINEAGKSFELTTYVLN